ncbi:MAG: 30S ribosomal protein S18 [Rickettsiaceae bacterium]
MSKETTSDSSSSFENSSDGTSGKTFFKKSRGCPFSVPGAAVIDYKDPDLLSKFISEGGRMLPSRITNVSSKHQRALKKAIKHSRTLALLPFVYLSK